MRLSRWVSNLLWVRPLRRQHWPRPLGRTERRELATFRRKTGTAPPGGRRRLIARPSWWLGKAEDGSRRIKFDLRVLMPDELTALRAKAISNGYEGRAWQEGSDYLIGENSFIWVSGRLELPSGVVVCNLFVFQPRESFSGSDSIHAHRIDIEKKDWRSLKRASKREERLIYSVLESSQDFSTEEVESR